MRDLMLLTQYLEKNRIAVYFLFNENMEIVYIGKTEKSIIRVMQHREGVKNNDSWYKDIKYIAVCPSRDGISASITEVSCIDLIKPYKNSLVVNYIDWLKTLPMSMKHYAEIDRNEIKYEFACYSLALVKSYKTIYDLQNDKLIDRDTDENIDLFIPTLDALRAIAQALEK